MIRGLGVQTSTSSPSCLSTSSTRFIPTSAIQDIFIHEAFKGFEVRFYLNIVVEGEEDVVVVFPVSTLSCTAEPIRYADDVAEHLTQATDLRGRLARSASVFV